MGYPTASKDTTIPVGSVVKVINSGHGYSTYTGMAQFMGLDNWGDTHRKSRSPVEGGFYHVIAKGVHENGEYGEILGLQREDGHQCMIGIVGVKLVAAPAPSPVLSVSGQVAKLEEQLAAVTKERDELKEQIATVRRLFTAQ